MYTYTLTQLESGIASVWLVMSCPVLFVMAIVLFGVALAWDDAEPYDRFGIAFVGVAMLVISYIAFGKTEEAIQKSFHIYKNEKVIGKLNRTFSQDFQSKGTYHLLYADYIVDGQHVAIQINPNQAYPDEVVFYKNEKFIYRN